METVASCSLRLPETLGPSSSFCRSEMSINDISTCLKGGRSCGVVSEEVASNLLWCEHCGIALCFDCDVEFHNSKNLKHGHLRVLLPASRTEAVRKCEHGADGSSNVHLSLISKPSPPKSSSRRRGSKKEKGSSNSESGRSRSSSSRHEGDDVGDSAVKVSDPANLNTLEEASSVNSLNLLRSALRGGSAKAGLGSRSKQHVTWHPDVKEPVCSLVSHTVGHKRSPAFLSRRSHQKQLRQKSKASSKSHARAKKQESSKHRKREPVKLRPDVESEFGEILVPELGSSEGPGAHADVDFADRMLKDCTYCMQEERLCECVNTSDGSISDPYLQSIILESAVHPESGANKTVQDSSTGTPVDKKAAVFVSDDECVNESLSEEYRQLLASMFHAATSLGQNKTLGSRAKYDAASGLFRDVKMHTPGASLSGSEEVFKQAAQGKISPWISVV